MDWHILLTIPLLGLTGTWRGVRIGDVGGLGASNNPLVQAFDKAKAAGDREGMEKAARQLNEQRLERNRAESKKDAPSGSKAAVLKSEEAAIRNNKFETAVLVGDDGRVLLKKEGGATSVGFSGTEIESMRGQTLTHNHPQIDNLNPVGHSFSPDDLKMLSNGRLAEIRAVTSSVEYSMSLNPSSRQAIANGKTGSSRKSASSRLYNESKRGYEDRVAMLFEREGGQSKNLMDVWYHQHHLISREYAKASGGAATYKVTGSKESLAELARIEQIYDGI